MIKTYVAYYLSGLLEAYGTLDEADLPTNFSNYLVDQDISNISIDSHYIPDINVPVLTEKPLLPIIVNKSSILANDVDSITFSGIPVGTALEIYVPIAAQAQVPSIINDLSITFTSIIPGEYTFIFSLPYHQDFVFNIEVISL